MGRAGWDEVDNDGYGYRYGYEAWVMGWRWNGSVGVHTGRLAYTGVLGGLFELLFCLYIWKLVVVTKHDILGPLDEWQEKSSTDCNW
jgi:hypothetical protein